MTYDGTELLTKPANQNLDVRFTQTRDPLQWYATIKMGPKETFKIGPANIAALLNNVANLIRTECAYSDLKVHGPEACEEAAKPRKRRIVRGTGDQDSQERLADGKE
jgi:hypothetical protein